MYIFIYIKVNNVGDRKTWYNNTEHLSFVHSKQFLFKPFNLVVVNKVKWYQVLLRIPTIQLNINHLFTYNEMIK